jgi:ribonuclease BN (tRNA processing enzyme)
MKITLLGTGTPAPSLRRQSAGYAFEVGSDLIVFDHGPGAHHRLLEAGYRAADVTHFFLTHYHYDHIMDYPRLVLTRWDHGRPGLRPLRIYGPPPLREINDRFIGVSGAFALDIAARTQSPASLAVYAARGGKGERPRPDPQLQEVVPGNTVTGENWTVRVGPVSHVQPQLNCQSYRLETTAGSVVYSGDNGDVYEPFVEFARDCDVLIHMCHFLSGTEFNADYRRMTGSHLDVATTAQRAKARMLVLTHLLPLLDRPGVKERMVAEMAREYEGPIILGEDLMTIPLQPPMRRIAD